MSKATRQAIALELQYYRKFPSDWIAQRISSLMALYSYQTDRNVSTFIKAIPDIKTLPKWEQAYEAALPYARFLGTDVEVIWEAELHGVNLNDKKALKKFYLDLNNAFIQTHRLNTVMTPSGERVQVL